MKNNLYFGDCLDIMKRYIKDESVDLIYLDPPWNKKRQFNMLFREKNGSQAASQIKAFEDIWHWDMASSETYSDVVENGPEKVSLALQGLRTILGTCDMLAYLTMMAPRLIEMRRILKSTGSIYFHCDPTASHYIKLVMDAVFEYKHFQNEIVWCYSGASSPRMKSFARKHDIILRYSRGNTWTFNVDSVRMPYAASSTDRAGYAKHFKKKGDLAGGKCKLNKGGKFPEDWWPIPFVRPNAKERLGYPTQKPLTLLERIIKASSNEGDVVCDPFCGCGTTVDAAQRLNRSWIGIDIAYLAISVIEKRLKDTYGDDLEYELIGEPISVSDARALAKHDRFHFQTWALGIVGARPSDPKKGADKGIDGRLFFHDGTEGKTKQIILSVKSGKSSIGHIRELWEVREREQAELGVLIAMEKPTRTMKSEAAAAGFYHSPWETKHPRLQILTIEEILNGKEIDYPRTRADATYKKAQRFKGQEPDQLDIFNEGA